MSNLLRYVFMVLAASLLSNTYGQWSQTYGDVGLGSLSSFGMYQLEPDFILLEEHQIVDNAQVMRLRKVDVDQGTEISMVEWGAPGELVYPSVLGSGAEQDGLVALAYTTLNAQGLTTTCDVYNGNLELQHHFTQNQTSEVYWNQVSFAPSGNVLLAGSTDSTTTGQQGVLVELRSLETGNVIWTRVIESQTPNESSLVGYGIEWMDDGNVLISSRRTLLDSFNNCSAFEFDRGRVVHCLSPSGDVLWGYDGDVSCGFDYVPKAKIGDAGEWLIACGDVGSQDACSGEEECYAPSLTKLSTSGEEIWRIAYGPHSIAAHLNDLEILENGDVVACGTEWNMEGGQQQGVVLKVDAEGGLIWRRTYRFESDRPSGLRSLVVLADQRIAVAGFSDISISSSMSNSWAMVLDEDGCLEEGCSTSIVEANEVDVVLYPNPTEDQVVFKSSVGIASVDLFDMSGRHVRHLQPKQSEGFALSMKGFQGSYLAVVCFEDGTVSRQRLLVK